MMKTVLLVVVALITALPAHASLPPSRSLDEILARMAAIQRLYPADDGIARFNYVYGATTANMKAAIEAGRFNNPDFMRAFTIRFADHYLTAFDDFWNGRLDEVPLSWRPLFALHEKVTEFEPVQFVIAGMDAHIGRDLPVTLAQLFAGEAGYPERDSALRADYDLVNVILRETFAQVHDHILTRCEDPLGALFCMFSDGTAIPTIAAIRRKAWFDGHALWRLQTAPATRATYLGGLDAATSALIRTVMLFHHH